VSTFQIEQAIGPLDQITSNPLPSLVKKLPNKEDFNGLSQPELRQHFEAKTDKRAVNATLFIAKRLMPTSHHTVGLAGIEIKEDTAVLTELVVDDRARGHKLGWELIRRSIMWSSENGAKAIEVSPPPVPDSTADTLLKEMGFSDQTGIPHLDLEDSQLTKG
jgi:N-acetylglutamate synthase-like GNAT family acetyltransferase